MPRDLCQNIFHEFSTQFFTRHSLNPKRSIAKAGFGGCCEHVAQVDQAQSGLGGGGLGQLRAGGGSDRLAAGLAHGALEAHRRSCGCPGKEARQAQGGRGAGRPREAQGGPGPGEPREARQTQGGQAATGRPRPRPRPGEEARTTRGNRGQPREPRD